MEEIGLVSKKSEWSLKSSIFKIFELWSSSPKALTLLLFGYLVPLRAMRHSCTYRHIRAQIACKIPIDITPMENLTPSCIHICIKSRLMEQGAVHVWLWNFRQNREILTGTDTQEKLLDLINGQLPIATPFQYVHCIPDWGILDWSSLYLKTKIVFLRGILLAIVSREKALYFLSRVLFDEVLDSSTLRTTRSGPSPFPSFEPNFWHQFATLGSID